MGRGKKTPSGEHRIRSERDLLTSSTDFGVFVTQRSLHCRYSFEVQEKLEEFYTGGQVQV